jgi:hypothetical protein
VLVTTFRSDPSYPRVVAYVAWIDHTRTQLGLYPGRYEPPGASPRGPMEVPAGQRYRLVATFNSGFTYGDGHGGFAVDGQTATSLRAGDGTLVAYRDGHVDVTTWRGGPSLPRWLVLARQNLPLIVDRGRPNPLLYDSNQFWGYTLGNAVRVWRSGVGIDRYGNIIYAAADLQTAGSIADLHHLRRGGGERSDQARAELPAADDALPLPRRPGLLRRLPAAGGNDRHRAVPLIESAAPTAALVLS